MNNMTTPRIEELENYKEPTQLNGTDYYRLPVNKLEHIIAKARQAGIDEAVLEIRKTLATEGVLSFSVEKALDDTIKALQDNK